MYSMLPDQPVAITGLPKNIASAGPRPNPSERCSDRKQSQQRTRFFASLSLSVASIRVTRSPKRAMSARNSSAVTTSWEEWPSLSTSCNSAPGRAASVRAKASTTAAGFLRGA